MLCRQKQVLMWSLLTIGFSLTCNSVNADPLTFFLTNGAGTAGLSLQNNGFYTESGVTISIVSTNSTLPGATGSSYSAKSTGSGVDTGGVTTAQGDEASELDAGETLVFGVSFAQPNISLTSIDFGGQTGDSNAGDQIFVNVAGTPFALSQGVAGFNGTSDLWTPSGGISIASGANFTFTAEQRYILDAITFEVSAIPEPGSLVLLTLATIWLGSRRRRIR